MIELFPDISENMRKKTKFWVDLALCNHNLYEGLQLISEYVNRCKTEREKEYVDFYFNLRLEQLIDESNFN